MFFSDNNGYTLSDQNNRLEGTHWYNCNWISQGIHFRSAVAVDKYRRRRQNKYPRQIRLLWWVCTLGRINIYIDVSLISSHLAQPHIGYMEQVLHIFRYLKHQDHSTNVVDPNYMTWVHSHFTRWLGRIVKNTNEAIPPNLSPTIGNYAEINTFVDSDHTGDRRIWCLYTEILIYLTCTSIILYSKA